MKNLTKTSLVAVALALLGAAAQADDQQLTNRLAVQNAQDPAPSRSTSVAVYAGNGGAVGSRDAQDPRPDTTFELRPNGHGQLIAMYRAAQ